MISPLMRIEFISVLPDLNSIGTLIFTSANGVRAFVQSSDRRDIPCYCVGDATARLARDEGLNATSCEGAADDLIARIIKDNVITPCLHIRGDHGAGDVANRLTSAGVPTTEVLAYRQIPQALKHEARALLNGENPVILPLFSPRTARLLPKRSDVSTEILVAALSENVASALPEGFAMSVAVAKRPDAMAMLDTVRALIDPGKALEGVNLAQ